MTLEGHRISAFLMAHLRSIRPSSTPEIGFGNGLNGLLARKLLVDRLHGWRRPRGWTMPVDDILGRAEDVHPHRGPICSRRLTGSTGEIVR